MHHIPAGSFRWERLVKSSLASSIVGFINGGRSPVPFFKSSTLRVTSCTCRINCQFRRRCSNVCHTYLAVLELEDNFDLVPVLRPRSDLRSNPSLSGIRPPDPRPNIVSVRHDAWWKCVVCSPDRLRASGWLRTSGKDASRIKEAR